MGPKTFPCDISSSRATELQQCNVICNSLQNENYGNDSITDNEITLVELL